MLPEDDSRTFSKEDRLTSALSIKDLMTQHETAFSFPIKCYYRVIQKDTVESDCKLAVLVSKKRFRRAVDRNRIKRLLRESYRSRKFHFETQTTPPQQLQMCWFFVHNRLPDLASLHEAAHNILQQIDKRMKA